MARKGLKIWKNCAECLGTGILHMSPNSAYPRSTPTVTDPPTVYEEVTCHGCNGIGLIHWGWLNEEQEVV